MGYRVLCDENVSPQTVRYLERGGHDAVHVREVLHLGVDDPSLARHARENGRVILTNDSDLLDDEDYPDVKVLYFPDNRLSAYELSTMVGRVSAFYPDQADLPRMVFLSEENLG